MNAQSDVARRVSGGTEHDKSPSLRSRAGLQHDPKSIADRDPWTFHMKRGEFAAAWEICDRILRGRGGQPCWPRPRHEQWIWDGASLLGKRVLIRCYHGLGDTVQFIRFASQVKTLAREVMVWAQPALLPILHTAPGIDRLLPLHEGAPEVDYDIDVESMELAHALRVSPESLTGTVPYLHATPVELPRSNERALHVGLVWSVGDWDHETRAIPLRTIRPLLELPGIEWHVLQRGRALAEWPREIGRISGTDAIEQTAAVMRALDLVISVDSFPAHLAGALAVPVWTLLPEPADWRWMDGRADSPWYPTMRLFRQPRAGDWPAVIIRVRDALRELAATHAHAHAA